MTWKDFSSSPPKKKNNNRKKNLCVNRECIKGEASVKGIRGKRPSIMYVHCFVWGWRGILSLAAENPTNTWHIHSCWKRAGPDTNWHAKSQRKQEKRSPVGRCLFDISFVSHPKEQLGKRGWEGDVKERENGGRKTSICIESQDTQAYARGDLTCYCKTSGEGSSMWPNLAHSLVVCSDLWPLLQRTGQTQTTSPQQWAIDASGLNSNSCTVEKKGGRERFVN